MMSRKDKQSEKRERTKESWGLYQTSNKEEKKRNKLDWSKENWKQKEEGVG